MESVRKSVQTVIESGRIGSPVFLRCALQVANESDMWSKVSLLEPVTVVARVANGWMPSKPEHIYAQGDAEGTQLTLMVKYTGGEIALLNVNRVEKEPGVDIMLVGNRGVIYHETPTGRHRLGVQALDFGGSGELTAVISRALESGQPIRVEG